MELLLLCSMDSMGSKPPHNTEGSSHFVFHAGHNETLLFSSLVVSTRAHLVAVCVVVCILGVLHEGLKLMVARLQVLSSTRPPTKKYKTWLLGCLQTGVYVVYLVLNYSLMLVFMTLNAWICLSLLLGAGLGHLVFHFQPLHSKFFRCWRKKSGEEGKSEESTIYGSSGHLEQEEYSLNTMGGSKR